MSDSIPKVINFYSTGDEFGEFSNFAAFPITLDGMSWPTSEHYFQAQSCGACASRSHSPD